MLAFRDSVAALAVMAGKGEEAVGGLREQIHKVSLASVQMQTDVTEALAAFVEKTGNIEVARKNLELYGKVATATGASMKDVALVGAELADKLKITDRGQQGLAFGILAAQSKAGAVEIRDLATKAPKIFSSASAMFGVEAIEGLRGTGALAQVYAKAYGGTGTSANIATSIQNTFTDIIKNRDRVERTIGHSIKGEDPYEIIKELVRATGGDTEKLIKHGKTGVFNIQALRGINILADEYRRTGKFGTFDTFKNVTGGEALIDRDFAIRANTGQAKLNAAQAATFKSSDVNLGDKFDALANHAGKLAAAFDWATRNLALTASALTVGLLGKSMAGSVLGSALRGGPLGVQHVYIAGAAPGVGLGAGNAQQFGNKAAAAFGVLAAASIGYAIGTILEQKFGISGKVAKVAGDITGQSTGRLLDEQDASNAQAKKLSAAKAERDARVKYYESKGMSHGEAVASADSIAEAIRQMKLAAININIDSDGKATAESEGTRNPTVMVRRGKMTYVNEGAQ